MCSDWLWSKTISFIHLFAYCFWETDKFDTTVLENKLYVNLSIIATMLTLLSNRILLGSTFMISLLVRVNNKRTEAKTHTKTSKPNGTVMSYFYGYISYGTRLHSWCWSKAKFFRTSSQLHYFCDYQQFFVLAYGCSCLLWFNCLNLYYGNK